MSLLPNHPCLDQYRRQAKELFHLAKSGDPLTLELFRKEHPKSLTKPQLRLTDAQLVIARQLGFASWPKLKAAVEIAEAKDFFEDISRCDIDGVKRRLARSPGLARAALPSGETALHVAAEHNYVPLAEILLNAGADPSRFYGFSSHTPLSWAVTVGSFDFARELVRLGEEPDLFSAAGLGQLDKVKSFWIDGKLRPNASKTGSSRFGTDGTRLPRPPETDGEIISDAFVIASRSGYAETAMWLLSQGADLNFRGYLGATALHWAHYSGNDKLCELLRTAGASDDLLDQEFLAKPRAFGSIVPAAWGLVPRLTKILDTYPEDVNIQGGYGTPLNASVWNGQIGTTKLLLERGGDPTLRNAAGATPLDVAKYRGFPELIALLESNSW